MNSQPEAKARQKRGHAQKDDGHRALGGRERYDERADARTGGQQVQEPTPGYESLHAPRRRHAGNQRTAVTRSDSSYTLVDWLSGNSWGAKKQSVIQHWHCANPTMSKAFARPHSRAKTAPTDCFFLCSSTVSGIFTPLVAPSSPRWVAPGPFPSARSARFLPALTRESMRFPFPHPSRETGEIPS